MEHYTTLHYTTHALYFIDTKTKIIVEYIISFMQIGEKTATKLIHETFDSEFWGRLWRYIIEGKSVKS